MPVNSNSGRATFGLLPEPEGRAASFITSTVVNLIIVTLAITIGMMARHVIDQHHFEQTELIVPAKPVEEKPKVTPPPKLPPPPKMPDVKLDAPRINLPKPEPKPDVKPIVMEAKVTLPTIKGIQPKVIEAPQPKAAMTAAMPAQDSHVKASTAPVHFGQTFGVLPNPNARGPATVAAIGNQYGGSRGPAIAPHGVVGSAGIGNGLKSGSNAGMVGKVASAGIPGASSTGASTNYGKVAAAQIPVATKAVAFQQVATQPQATELEVLSKPSVQYTSEAKQLKVQGDVVLRVTFTAAGRVVVQGVVHGLGHGLDEEARRVAQLIRYRPATRNGQAVDLTTNITITFQLA
jgi:TonB family protein